MHFTNLSLRNFGPFASLDLNFKLGSIGIFGLNGTGKTTVINSMYSLLTNDFGRFDGVKSDCVYSLKSQQEESYIQGTIIHNDISILIKRSIYPSKTLLVINNKEITDSRKAQQEIDNILNIDSKLLSLYVFKPQDCIYDFISSQPAARAKSFAVLCRTEKCELIWDFLGKFISNNSDINTVIEDNSDELLTEIAQLKLQLTEIESSYNLESEKLLNSKSEQSAREILRKHDRLGMLHNDKERVGNSINNTKELLKEKEALLVTQETKCNKLKQKLTKYTKLAEDARVALQSWVQYSKQKQREAELKKEQTLLCEEFLQNKEPEALVTPLTEEDLLSQLVANKELLHNTKEILNKLTTTGLISCPTCGTPVTSLQDYIKEQKLLVISLPKTIKKQETQLREIKNHVREVRDYNKWLITYNARLAANKKSLEMLEDLKVPDGTKEEFKSVLADYDYLCADCEKVNNIYLTIREHVNELKTNLKLLQERFLEVNNSIAENTVSLSKVEKVRGRLYEHLNAVSVVANLQGQREIINRQILDKEKSLVKLKNKLKRLKNIRKAALIVNSAREVMHRDNLPRYVAHANLSSMEADINKNLALFGDPFWVEVDSNLSFIIHKPGEPAQPAGRLSTGQRVILALSFWPAVASLWSSDLGMLVLDEPTANLDEENRKFLFEALGSLTAKVRGHRQLIMVTHDINLRNAFDQIIDLNSV